MMQEARYYAAALYLKHFNENSCINVLLKNRENGVEKITAILLYLCLLIV